MLNPTPLDQNSLINYIGQEIYTNSATMINSFLSLRGLPLLYRFATNLDGYRVANDAPYPNDVLIAIGMEKERERDFGVVNKDNKTSVCMFAYEDYDGISWRNRECGSTDTHYDKIANRRRYYAGNVIEAAAILESYCCSTGITNVRAKLTGIVNSVLTNLISIMQARIFKALFADITEITNGQATTKTFIDDTGGTNAATAREIDLSAAGLTLQKIIQGLSSIVSMLDNVREYYWFVPANFFSLIMGLGSTANCCYLLNNIDRGTRFSALPNINIYPIDASYFPPAAANKVTTALVPAGTVAMSLMRPSGLASIFENPNKVDILSLSQEMYQREVKAIFNPLSIVALIGKEDLNLNYNASIQFMTAFVAGRLPGKMYRVLVSTNPT